MQALPDRIAKHLRLNWKSLAITEPSSPPFLILFINSICNMKCEHCFYWKQLNQRDDLSFDEIVALSEELGPIENLNLSGGEPFLRKEFAEICLQFIRKNGVKEIYVPTNGYFKDRTVKALRKILTEAHDGFRLFGVELSLDGMPEFHDEFRKSPNSFRKAMETYDALAELQREFPRLQIHAISTATHENMGEIRQLTTYLYDRCPQMSHHNLAIIRGDRKNPSLKGPQLEEYRSLYDYVRRLWAPREEARYGSIVEPMLQWTKLETIRREEQVVPCRAGILTAVVNANGDVGICEQREILGNLRKSSFTEIWRSHLAKEVRKSIACKECFCTNEIFMWPSIVYQPLSLAQALSGSRAWRQAEPLPDADRVSYEAAAAVLAKPLGRTRPEAEVAAEFEADETSSALQGPAR